MYLAEGDSKTSQKYKIYADLLHQAVENEQQGNHRLDHYLFKQGVAMVMATRYLAEGETSHSRDYKAAADLFRKAVEAERRGKDKLAESYAQKGVKVLSEQDRMLDYLHAM